MFTSFNERNSQVNDYEMRNTSWYYGNYFTTLNVMFSIAVLVNSIVNKKRICC